jgi:hypothetical protein
MRRHQMVPLQIEGGVAGPSGRVYIVDNLRVVVLRRQGNVAAVATPGEAMAVEQRVLVTDAGELLAPGVERLREAVGLDVLDGEPSPAT